MKDKKIDYNFFLNYSIDNNGMHNFLVITDGKKIPSLRQQKMKPLIGV
jgi:hypothetical protein